MKKKILFSLKSPYREQLDIIGFRFGHSKKSLVIVGAMRGNEVQQMYVCSRMVQTLKKLESEGRLAEDTEILVVPCVNYYSMNILGSSGSGKSTLLRCINQLETQSCGRIFFHTIKQTDTYRAEYYKYYTHGNYWTNPINYDMTLNSERVGIDECVELIKAYMKIKGLI